LTLLCHQLTADWRFAEEDFDAVFEDAAIVVFAAHLDPQGILDA